MSNDELREQIEALRSEVRQLNASFVNLREDDVRRVFVQQVRPVLVERIDRALGWPGSVGNRDCREALVEWTEEVLEGMERGGGAGGLRFLEGRSARSVLRERSRPDLNELADDLDDQMRRYLDSYGAVLRFPRAAEGTRTPEIAGPALSPAKVEAALGPLSNGIRIGILQHLAREDDGLASLSRAQGLQKGHLQFHIRSLMGGGYIAYDRKSRLYSVTVRGRRALDGLTRLMDDLER